jgi:hypothetical protein
MITLGKIAAKVKSEIILDRILPYVVSTRFPEDHSVSHILRLCYRFYLEKLYLTLLNVLKLSI